MYYDNQNNNGFANINYRRPSMSMAKWSMILGIIAICTSMFILPAVILGSLAVILGFLSRGGQQRYPGLAIVGIICGLFGIVSGVVCFIFGFYLLIEQYGSYENFMNAYIEMLNSYYEM
ncbi:MAG: DUF4190 domain-containing protein [Lachnospiraceae bacterium]|nr:DUF4190 domain-containing protein [Lachnospiraceae bacterium]